MAFIPISSHLGTDHDLSIYGRPSSSSAAVTVVRGWAGSAYVVVQIQPRKPVLDHADYTSPPRQDELDHTRSGKGLP